MKYRELTEKIIGCAYRVYNRMGYGFLESVYEKCLLIELRNAGLSAVSQKPITVFYDNKVVGEFVADIISRGHDHFRIKVGKADHSSP
jgi:GxxExxY protein